MANKHHKQPFVWYLALWGCISTGIVYGAIGIIAILSFLKLKEGGADEGSLLVYLHQYTIGTILVWVILLGMLSYIAWRIYEAIKDPYGYGTSAKGIMKRSAVALSGLADALIAFSAVQALLGTGGTEKTGDPAAQREMGAWLLEQPWGVGLLIGAGLLTVFTALMQFGYVIARSYEERMHMEHLAPWKKTAIHILACTGHFARGFILGIIGYSAIRAGADRQPQHIVNTDKAFDFIGDHIGHVWFILIAIGTICYGIFMIVFGIKFDEK